LGDVIAAVSPIAEWALAAIVIGGIVGLLVYIAVRYYRGGDPFE
jgi:hypothetical protein